MTEKRLTRYVEIRMSERQAAKCESALFMAQQHFEQCDTRRTKWEDEAIFRLRGALISELQDYYAFQRGDA